MSAFADSASLLRELALRNEVAMVLYSGGKDSLVLADLAFRAFRRIVLVHYYLVPGLRFVAQMLEDARARWPGSQVYEAPLPALGEYLARGLCCFPSPSMPILSMPEMNEFVRQDLGVRLLLHGAKKSDSIIMRRKIKAAQDPDLIYPIRDWNKYDILAYLGQMKVEPPDTPDISLSAYSLCWMHDNHPEDFARLCEIFPFAPAFVHRRDWYGVGAGKHKIR